MARPISDHCSNRWRPNLPTAEANHIAGCCRRFPSKAICRPSFFGFGFSLSPADFDGDRHEKFPVAAQAAVLVLRLCAASSSARPPWVVRTAMRSVPVSWPADKSAGRNRPMPPIKIAQHALICAQHARLASVVIFRGWYLVCAGFILRRCGSPSMETGAETRSQGPRHPPACP